MTATVSVSSKSVLKDNKDQKDRIKDTKEGKDTKEVSKDRKDQKDRVKERKDGKEFKEVFKERKDLKDRVEFKVFDRPGGTFPGPQSGASYDVSQSLADLDARVSALEAALGSGGEAAEPFISSELRPDLVGGPDYSAQQQNLQERMATGDRDAKVAYDSMPPK